MKIKTKALSSLTKDEFRACHYLNMRGSGMMMYSLSENREEDDCYAIMAWESGKLLGWALLIPHDKESSWYSTTYQKRKSKYIAQFYVRKPHRGKGIGARLMDVVNTLDSTPTVIPHDSTSSAFFASYEVVTEKCRRGMLTEAKKRKQRAA